VENRPAVVGDRLVSSIFLNSITRGFIEPYKCNVAVCLLPGTQLEIESPVRARTRLRARVLTFGLWKVRKIKATTAIFRQVNLERHTHHDALEFPSGECVLVTNLEPGNYVRVLQLPATMQSASANSENSSASVLDATLPVAGMPVDDLMRAP
jgi:hypothetical protein